MPISRQEIQKILQDNPDIRNNLNYLVFSCKFSIQTRLNVLQRTFSEGQTVASNLGITNIEDITDVLGENWHLHNLETSLFVNMWANKFAQKWNETYGDDLKINGIAPSKSPILCPDIRMFMGNPKSNVNDFIIDFKNINRYDVQVSTEFSERYITLTGSAVSDLAVKKYNLKGLNFVTTASPKIKDIKAETIKKWLDENISKLQK